MAQAPREAANFSRPEGFSGDDFRRRTEEYIGIVQDLWQGWDADALLFDKSGGRFHEPGKMHLLDHKGEFFSVRGPLNVARSPQDTPVLVLSGLVGARHGYCRPHRRCRHPAGRRTDREREGTYDDQKRLRCRQLGRSPGCCEGAAEHRARR